MKKFIKRLLVVLLILIVGLGVAGYFYRSASRQKWQRATAELQSKGEKLSVADLAATVATNADEFISVLNRAAQDPVSGPKNFDVNSVLPFTDAGRVSIAWRLDSPTWIEVPKGSPAPTWADASNFVAQLSPALVELRQALKSPPANLGMLTNAAADATEPKPESPLLVTQRKVGRRLALATMVDLRCSRRADALADVLALAGLCGVNRENYNGAEQASRLALMELGLGATWQILQAADWNDEQLAALQRSWQDLDGFEILEKVALADRADTLWLSGEISAQQSPYPSGAPTSELLSWARSRVSKGLWIDTVADADLTLRLRHTQGEVETIRTLETNAPWKTVFDSLAERDQKLEGKSHVPQKFLFPFSTTCLDLKPVASTAVRVETQRRLTVSAIAARRYRVKNNRWPPTLETLTPEFLRNTPRDCINGQPLHYQAAGGTFILYSIGEDGRDNGGDPSSPGSRAGWWTGRDVVWPSASK